MPIAAPDRTYVYAATVRRVMDGDTLELDVDLGFHVIARQSIRMEGGDAAELRSKVPEERTKAQAAMARLAALLPPGSSCTLQSVRTEKYGRWLGVVWPKGAATSANATMLAEGHHQPYSGGKR